MKKCSKCKKEKPLIQFGKDKYTKDGYQYWCKSCKNSRSREIHKEDPSKAKKRNDRKKLTRKKYYQSKVGIESSRRSHLKRKFGITLEYYNELLNKQKGLCAICKSEETSTRSNFLSVDHDHETGKIRGLLCNNCNRGLGLLRDDQKLLENAIKYLKHE